MQQLRTQYLKTCLKLSITWKAEQCWKCYESHQKSREKKGKQVRSDVIDDAYYQLQTHGPAAELIKQLMKHQNAG